MADLTDISATVGIWSLGDFRPDMPVVTGRTALIHRLCVRLQTPRGRFSGVGSDGKVWGWPNFGTDIAQFLLSKTPPSVIAAAAEAECLKDEQVEQAAVVATLQDGGRRMQLEIAILDAIGPFTFSLGITQAKAELIELQVA